jgi:CHAD domain-containing protein
MRRVRVASRRLRAALTVVLAATAPEDARGLMRRLRALARRFGPARDLAVARALVADEIVDHPEDTVRLDAMRVELGRREREAQDGLGAGQHRRDLRRLDRRLRAVVRDVRASAEDARWIPTFGKVLARRVREARTAFDRCGTLYEPDRLHRLRVVLKKLRYALEIAAEARWVSPALAAALVTHHRRLGAWHDRVVLEALAREAAARESATADDGLNRVLARFERDARQWHGRIRRASPALAQSLDAIRRAVAAGSGLERKMARGRMPERSRTDRRTA